MLIGFYAMTGLLIMSGTLWLRPIWRVRQQLVYIYMIVQVAMVIVGVLVLPRVWAVLFLSATAYALVNLLRTAAARMQADYLRQASLRSWLFLLAIQTITILASHWSPSVGAIVSTVIGVQLICGLIVLSSTMRHLRTTKTLQATAAYTDAQLPSISVLIPARNETDDLVTCLEALLASDYPKLEILVLDDCSQLKQTPEIIRGFAHDGVRFIAGQAPDASWLAKNYAYQQLTEAASGEYLLFIGVDVRVSPGAIRELMTTMLEKQKTMVSILPLNRWPKAWLSVFIQPMRYAWELSLPRRLFNRPPVLSTCWIIARDTLQSAGGFKATSRSVVPESYFARLTMRHDRYSFLRSNMLVSDKSSVEQQATSIRMRYPQLHRRIELVYALTLIEFIGLVLPVPMAIGLLVSGHMVAASGAILAAGLQYIALLQVTGVMYGRPVFTSGPLQALYDISLSNYSMWRYEFGEVIWKDRNICLPVMRQPAYSEQKR